MSVRRLESIDTQDQFIFATRDLSSSQSPCLLPLIAWSDLIQWYEVFESRGMGYHCWLRTQRFWGRGHNR